MLAGAVSLAIGAIAYWDTADSDRVHVPRRPRNLERLHQCVVIAGAVENKHLLCLAAVETVIESKGGLFPPSFWALFFLGRRGWGCWFLRVVLGM